MKTSSYLFLSALAAGPLVAAAPAPVVLHQRVDAEVDIYVDQNRHTVRAVTKFETRAPTWPTGAAFVQNNPSSSSVSSSSTSSAQPGATGAPKTGSSSGDGSFSNGVTYTPYKVDPSDPTKSKCKTSQEIQQDVAGLQEYDLIRVFGPDCGQIAPIMAASGNAKLFLGIFDVANYNTELQQIIDQMKGNWDRVHTVSVGNEWISSGKGGAGDLTGPEGAIAKVKTALQGAGYNGPVVTVEHIGVMKSNIGLCQASDYCAMNCHPFFDVNTDAAGAGTFVKSQIDEVAALAGGKKVVVTETGWPSRGDAHDKAIPTKENQQTALSSIKSAVSSNVILLNSYNEYWKQDNANTHGAEKYWGVKGDAPSGN